MHDLIGFNFAPLDFILKRSNHCQTNIQMEAFFPPGDRTYHFILPSASLMNADVFSFIRFKIDLYLKFKFYFKSDRN